MQVEETTLPGVLLLKPVVHGDERGFFLESFRQDFMEKLPFTHPFVQDNHAKSGAKGVLRGLHFQLPPADQGKLVSVIHGSIFDVAVDLRLGSPTYGKWFGATLSAQNFLRIFVPRGFAHGYITLEDNTEVQYKTDNYYNAALDSGIAWNDPDIGVIWPDITPQLSAKDGRQQSFKDFRSPFAYKA